MLLAADVGGSNTRLGWFAIDEPGCAPVVEVTVRTRDYPSLDVMLEECLRRSPRPVRAACLGVAAPVSQGRTEPINLPWVVEVSRLQRVLGVESVWLLNDLEAMAYGIPLLSQDAWVALQHGHPAAQGAIGIMAAGTSLGEAMLMREADGAWRAMASEGGHADFAPRSTIEWELREYLARRFNHVSYARVLSGPGLVHLYEFLKARGAAPEPPWLTAQLAAHDPSEVISTCGLSGRSALCVQALELFTAVLGAEAGNVSLRVLARGGLYLGGGIAPKILPTLQERAFLRAFTDKGRLAPLLATIPVRVILEERTALYGAAQRGKALLHARDPLRHSEEARS